MRIYLLILATFLFYQVSFAQSKLKIEEYTFNENCQKIHCLTKIEFHDKSGRLLKTLLKKTLNVELNWLLKRIIS